MNKKGFTLIEILTVVFILGVILSITVPIVLGLISNSKQNMYDMQVKNIEKAAETYILKNSKSIPSLDVVGGVYYLSLQDLYDEGYIDLPIKNNLTNENFSNNTNILVTKTKINEYTYEFPVSSNLDVSGASLPELSSNMIPVYYDSTCANGGLNCWKKAKVANNETAYKWYNYDNKIWANAVTVKATGTNTRSYYKDATVGTTILDADILTFMVWIPRYKYYITTSGTSTPSEIQITFESKTTTKSTGNAISTYRTHPAFTFGNKELSGIWVGKFEVTGSISAITIKSSETSIKAQTVSSFFTNIKNMENTSNAYGYVANEVDTHMMKNSEWGAAAYLSRSKYGFNQEIWINPNNAYKTGQAGTDVSTAAIATTANYNELSANGTGPNASTTGNVYGIYDMSGGSWEYVMGNYNNYSGYLITTNSGFSGYNGNDETTTIGLSFPLNQYYNLYTTSVNTTACNGGICYGHALSETASWNSDYSYINNADFPWTTRGGGNGSGIAGGIFAHYNGNRGTGYSSNDTSTRVVQTME